MQIEQSLSFFQNLIFGRHVSPLGNFGYGNYLQVNILYCSLNGRTPNQEQSEPEIFSSTFMQTFFVKSNFRTCPNEFADVILSLASLDFPYFLQSIVPIVNSEDFIANSFKPVNSVNISEFNSILRIRILPYLDLVRVNSENFDVISTETHEKNQWQSNNKRRYAEKRKFFTNQ
jgi:hypothetical protein